MNALWAKASRLLRSVRQKNVIRKKLLLYFLISAVLVNSICLYTYNNTRLLINKLNQIFINDITLTNLSNGVDAVHTSLKEYLTTNNSKDLEAFLNNSNRLREQTNEIRTVLSNDESELLLLDIKQMISTYLSHTAAAEYRKRGRDINGYSEYFNEASQVYDYINRYIEKLKIYQFQENNRNYLELDRWLGMLQTLNMLVILVAMLVNIALIFWFAWSITEPIIKLSKVAGQIADGNYDVPPVDVRTNDEVKSLATTFNRMTESIRKQLVEIRQKAEIESRLQDQQVQNLKMRTMLNESQLKTLQAQINPHFMFNTLNAGMQLALFEGAERTQTFLEKLAESLRYNLGDIGNSATLSQEIASIDNYVYLLRERFGDSVRYVKEIEAGLPDLSMPRMILQPIVENAFVHGIGQLEGGGEISLKAWRVGSHVLVRVGDKGPGMAPATQARLLAGQWHSQETGSGVRSHSGHGLGLGNVIERLMLYFGVENASQVLAIEGGSGDGTRITLTLPFAGSEET